MHQEPTKILLAEDETSVRAMISLILRASGYNVIEATNGQEALDVAQEQQGNDINLLLTDIVMPELNGLELASRFKRLYPQAKILLMSGYTEETCLKDITSDCNVAFLEKPFLPQVLTEKIQDLLDS